VLDDVLAARGARVSRAARTPPAADAAAESSSHEIQARLRARETPQPRFCWHCRKPLHARTDRCPFCGEVQ
jgi:hypothetical protein